MNVVYSILVAIAVIIAIAFSLLVLITGKGDAMSGGGSVRTTFKGKASFDDIMSKWTLYIGASFMALILVINVLSKRIDQNPNIERSSQVDQSAGNVPASTAQANVPAPSLPLPTNTAPTTTGSTANTPLNSAPATVPESGAATGEPSIVPSIPGTTAGGATNVAPPAGNR